MAIGINQAHRVMSQRVKDTQFCEEEGEKGWNTRLLYALDECEFIGDIVCLTRDELYRRTQLGEKTMAKLEAFLKSHGLYLGMSGPVVDGWERPH